MNSIQGAAPAGNTTTRSAAGADDGLRPIDRVLPRLEGVRPGGGGHSWTARCPAHGDKKPSLSVRIGDDERVLLHCHAGCPIDEVVSRLGLELSDLFAPGNHRPRGEHQRGTGDGSQNRQAASAAAEAKERERHQRYAAWWEAKFPKLERIALDGGWLRRLAEHLGLPTWVVPLYQVGYLAEEESGGRWERDWVWRELDATGRFSGVARRDVVTDKKSFFSDGHRGLTFREYDPRLFPLGEKYTLHPEGLSDVLAATAMGLYAVGRPSSTGGVGELVDYYVLRSPGTDGVTPLVLGERDGRWEVDKQTGERRWHEPGVDGMHFTARRLANELGRPVLMVFATDRVQGPAHVVQS
jgi:hypothetical protein